MSRDAIGIQVGGSLSSNDYDLGPRPVGCFSPEGSLDHNPTGLPMFVITGAGCVGYRLPERSRTPPFHLMSQKGIAFTPSTTVIDSEVNQCLRWRGVQNKVNLGPAHDGFHAPISGSSVPCGRAIVP